MEGLIPSWTFNVSFPLSSPLISLLKPSIIIIIEGKKMILLYLYYSFCEAPLMRGIVSVCSPAVLGTACFRQSDNVLKRQSAARALSLFGVAMTKARERFRQNTSGEVKIRSDRVFFKAPGKTTTTTRPLRCFLSPCPSCRRHLAESTLFTGF